VVKHFLALVLLIGSIGLPAGPAVHTIDQSHSQINFVAEARFISCHGFFDKWEADVQLDSQKVESSSVKLTIDASSINTRVARRDTHLRSKDFLWVEQHPQITFVSKRINVAGKNKYNIVGDLALRGITKEITVPAEMVFYENNRGRFRGTFQLNRKEFGITFDSRMNSIQDLIQVQFDINVMDKEATEKAQKAKSGSN
jgi:polyisoprenoid-binding protein YceI